MKIIIATIKSWNIERAEALQRQYEGVHDIVIYTRREEFTADNVCDFHPDYIFLPHWSYIMPREITDHWECVVFHMTDLPYGRGGSPLQNLIVRGHKETKISAIRMTEKLDGGPVYMKHALSLDGSAQEIFVRCADIIFREMIPRFLDDAKEKIAPVPQEGEPVIFKRRKPEDGRITPDMKTDRIYDHIRMLDAEGYPRAFIEFGDHRLEFEQAQYLHDDLCDDETELSARVVFRRASDQPEACEESQKKTVLVVAAHPDDEILGVGGTVARYTAQGDVVYALILGEGQTSRSTHREDTDRETVEALHRNTLESAKAVGYREVFFADFPDNRFDGVDLLDIVKAVEQKIRELRPQIIYTHYSGDLNVDHQYTARAVLTATRPMADCCVETVYAFETLSSSEWNFDCSAQPAFCPNVFVDITGYYGQKEQAMNCYVSELCTFPHPRSLTGMDVLSRTRGMAAGMQRAEAFMLIRQRFPGSNGL